MSDRIAVMQAGKIVEDGPAEEVYTQPGHQYTKTLLNSVPIPDPRRMRARKAERRRIAAAAGP
jgi:ABC-type oligopeptide transport system ATPase subunit